MLPIERQQLIQTWIEEEGSLRVSELSKRLNVSEMTVYRDIKPLVEQNKIIKTSSGIIQAPVKTASFNACVYCMKEAHSRHTVQIIGLEKTVEQACCLHCGLLYYAENEANVSHLLCNDFLYDTTMSATTGTFLIGADLHINCCHPQVVAFSTVVQAEKFQKGFGGDLYTLSEAMNALLRKTDCGCSCSL
ncbi:DeoR family transcriptional regulator [Peribacillus glennii]|uniref:DeoR/GlpR transcriptional regulator n=1 Tax=Peribacillus glennii TaxID=2303991 RepID=A0A372L701_9BACI|nr:DeoR family transcriptional regulator [Peribacillus glennii]RFU60926.1 DeoR/GlpR transcriptional regulator [Peribacillus glennii]